MTPRGARLGIRKGGKGAVRLPKILVLIIHVPAPMTGAIGSRATRALRSGMSSVLSRPEGFPFNITRDEWGCRCYKFHVGMPLLEGIRCRGMSTI